MKCIVVIGVSTGGPGALQKVIPLLPESLKAAVLIVQHMPPAFTKTLAERLNSMSALTVKEAEDGETIKQGCVYIAPGGYHMVIKDGRNGLLNIMLSDEAPRRGHKPSINITMNSLAETECPDVVAVIMTGMGSDGSEGIKKIKEKKNGFIIAQDENTSVVYGMPKAAVQTGCVDLVAPLGEIADVIVKKVGE